MHYSVALSARLGAGGASRFPRCILQLGKRKEYEDKIRKNRNLTSHWYKYSAWEESQQDFARCRHPRSQAGVY